MRKILTIICTLIILMSTCLSVYAVDHSQYGLEADVTPIVSSDTVAFDISIENISNEDIEGVVAKSSFPQGLSPTSATKKNFGTIPSGETVDFTINAALSSSPLTLTIGGETKKVSTSTFIISSLVLIAIIAFFAFGLKSKKFRNFFVFFLCLTLAVPYIGFVPTFAKSSDDYSFDIKETVTLDGVDYTVNFTFTVDHAPESSYVNCKNDASVDDATQDIQGTIVSDEEIISVDYKVYSEIDEGDLSFSGKAELNGGHYTISETVLKPDNNTIKVTATTKSGKTIENSFDIDYDSSSVYKETEADISTDKESGKKYINSIINVLFKENTSDEDKNSVVNELNGKKVGYINGANMWQIKVAKADFETLNSICDDLCKKDFVTSAYVDLLDITHNVIPDDPWGGSSWSEASPAGYNWNAEMIQALSAWDYDNYFTDINIGFVDTGCDYDHEDLNSKVVFTSTENKNICDEQKHGTHVAGIMGAIPNNQIGVSGVLWNGKIYAHDAQYKGATDDKESMTTTKCYNGVVQNVEAGAKVVNLSLGLSSLDPVLTEAQISSFSTGASSYVAYLLNQGYDFIICQSSGNGNKSGAAVDTRYNGMFCCIDQDETGQSEAMAKKIADRIMIVGSMNSGGSQASSSNYGAHVDVAAPGVSVYSTVPKSTGKLYDTMSGTSMASPLVTAMLGVVWSVNPELTGAEVANILKTTAASYRSAYPSVSGQSALPVPNLYTAVKAAIATLPSVDFTELDNAIALVSSDMSYYDSASVNAIYKAYNEATTVDREKASQNQINEVTQNLLNAIYSAKVSLASPAQITVPSTLAVGANTTSEVKFTCAGATDINISFSNNSIVQSTQSSSENTSVVYISGNELTSDDIGTITCTATYTYDGIRHTLRRYIEVIENIFANQPLVDTSVTRSGGSYLLGYNPSLYNIATITGTTKAENPVANASNGYFDYNKSTFVSDSNTAIGTKWGGYQLSGSDESNLMEDIYAPTGYLYVDTDKYSQLSEIPNLAIYIYQYKKCTRASKGTEVLSVTTDNQNYSVNVTDTELGDSANSVGGSQTYKINGPVPTNTTTISFHIQTKASSSGITSNPTTKASVFLKLTIVPQNKTNLGSLLEKLYTTNHQSLFYTQTSFENYSEALKHASVIYNDPYSEQIDIDRAYKSLKETFLALKFDEVADYLPIKYALFHARDLDADLYTDYSLGLLDEEINSVEAMPDNYFKSYQPYIDEKATDLLNAVDELPLLCGDLDANGTVDGNDAFLMSCILSDQLTEEKLGEYKYSAADADKDGNIDSDDYNKIFNKGLNP